MLGADGQMVEKLWHTLCDQINLINLDGKSANQLWKVITMVYEGQILATNSTIKAGDFKPSIIGRFTFWRVGCAPTFSLRVAKEWLAPLRVAKVNVVMGAIALKCLFSVDLNIPILWSQICGFIPYIHHSIHHVFFSVVLKYEPGTGPIPVKVILVRDTGEVAPSPALVLWVCRGSTRWTFQMILLK